MVSQLWAILVATLVAMVMSATADAQERETMLPAIVGKELADDAVRGGALRKSDVPDSKEPAPSASAPRSAGLAARVKAVFVKPGTPPTPRDEIAKLTKTGDTPLRPGQSRVDRARDQLAGVAIDNDGRSRTIPAARRAIAAIKDRISGSTKRLFERFKRKTGNTVLRYPAQSAGIAGHKLIIGDDDRQRIPVGANGRPPYVHVVQLSTGCTGTLIGPRHALTAAHCIYDINKKAWTSNNLTVSVALNEHAPVPPIRVVRQIASRGYTRDNNAEFDFALLILERSIGEEVGTTSVSSIHVRPGSRVATIGYPYDKPKSTMWRAPCQVKSISDTFYTADCDVAGGQSGSGLLWQGETGIKLIGVLALYEDPNLFSDRGSKHDGFSGWVRMSTDRIETLKKWMTTE
jgi:glutamyl endopeptidase